MDAIPIINDAVGGVTVKIEDDFSDTGLPFEEGEEVTLMGDDALHYIRARMSVGDGSNLSRMRRHRTYLAGFRRQMQATMEKDPNLSNRLYEELQPYMVTDITGKVAGRLAQAAQSYTNNGIFPLSGEAKEGKKFMEYYIDEDSLMETVLSLFYVPAD